MNCIWFLDLSCVYVLIFYFKIWRKNKQQQNLRANRKTNNNPPPPSPSQHLKIRVLMDRSFTLQVRITTDTLNPAHDPQRVRRSWQAIKKEEEEEKKKESNLTAGCNSQPCNPASASNTLIIGSPMFVPLFIHKHPWQLTTWHIVNLQKHCTSQERIVGTAFSSTNDNWLTNNKHFAKTNKNRTQLTLFWRLDGGSSGFSGMGRSSTKSLTVKK